MRSLFGTLGLREIGLIPIIIFGACVVSLFLPNPSFIETLELKTLDLRFRMCSRIGGNPGIVLLTVDDETLKVLGYPLSRDFYALLLDILSQVGAKAIGFDILFTDPDRYNLKYDNLLAEKTKDAGLVCHAVGFRMESGEAGLHRAVEIFPPLPQLEMSAKSLGHINIIPDMDGVIRLAPLLITWRGKPYYFLALQVVADYIGVSKDEIKATKGSIILGDIRIPVNERWEMLIDFSQEIDFPEYSVLDVLQSFRELRDRRIPRVNLQDFRDKLVLIGVTASGASDLKPTPKSPLSPMILTHAIVAGNILNKDFIHRAGPIKNSLVLLAIFLPFCLLLFLSSIQRAPLLLLCFQAGLFTLSIICFRVFGLWIEVVKPTLILFLSFLGFISYYVAAKGRLFRGYSLEQMVETIEFLKRRLKTHSKEVAFLNIDIANSTSMKEDEEDFNILRTFGEYHRLLEGIAKSHGGEVFSRAGDGVIFQFQGKDKVDQAVKTALKIKRSLPDFNRTQNRLRTSIMVRMGINYGEVTMDDSIDPGKVSSRAIDIAVHLGKEAKPGQILISEESVSSLKNRIRYEKIGYLEKNGIAVYLLKDEKSEVSQK